MAQTRVVILSGQSLFAEGIASRLRQYLQSVELEIVAPRELDVLARIAAIQPSVVILDTNEPEVTQFCPLRKLLGSLPRLKVIYLEREQIQVVTCEQRTAANIHDLADVIDGFV